MVVCRSVGYVAILCTVVVLKLEYMHDHLERFIQIILAFSLVLVNVPGFLEIKVLIDVLVGATKLQQ